MAVAVATDADRHRGVAELQEVDVLERVGAVRAAGAQIDDLPAAVGDSASPGRTLEAPE